MKTPTKTPKQTAFPSWKSALSDAQKKFRRGQITRPELEKAHDAAAASKKKGRAR